MTDFDIQRDNMVESQIRPADVTDRRILRAMQSLARESFIPASKKSLAYMDEDIEIREAGEDGPARFLAAPVVLARLIQLTQVEENDLVLDVGCGTGYSSALLASIAGAVVGLDDSEDLTKLATRNLQEMGIDNAAFVHGPLKDGCAGEGPFDVIVLNGGVPEPGDQLTGQLKDGGRLVCIIQDGIVGRATRFVKRGETVARSQAFDASLPPLPGFEKDVGFVF